MPSWTKLDLVLHQLGLLFDGLRDDLLRLGGVVLAALALIPSVRNPAAASTPPKAKRSKAKRGKPARRQPNRP